MSAKAPQVLSRKANGAASNTAGPGNEPGKGKGGANSRPKKRRGQGEKKNDSSKGREAEAPRPPRQRQQNDGGKLVLRRLPPGMTEVECLNILGETWALGKGKVDWFSFIPGKISTDPSKPSRPARAYIHLTKKDDMLALSEVVRSATWEDAKNSFTNAALVGPPSLELSSYKKVPSSKKRTDARQGTIDQDPEFMAFLEGLANPVPLRDNAEMEDGEDATKGEVKVTTTPLVEYLKEKKASKSKESSSGKKRGEGKNKSSKDDESSKKKGRESKTEKSEKTERGSKTTVKILTKKAATEQAADAARNAAKAINDAIAQDAPKSRRAGIATAARILQRDLGLSPGSAHRRARQDAAKAEAKAKEASHTADTQDATAEPVATQDGKAKGNSTAGKSHSGRRNRENKPGEKSTEPASTPPTAANPPVILKKKTEGPANTTSSAAPANGQQSASTKGPPEKNAKSSTTNSKASQSSKKPQTVTAGATKAFIKHAVHSQGVTEAALRQVLEPLGSITAIEMDKRKGFAYVDFADHDALVKAVAASPLSIGQASVQILERKEKKPAAVNPTATAGATNTSTTPEKDKAKDGDKDKEKGTETRRGRRGRGGKGNNGGGASNAPAAATPSASVPAKDARPANSG
ncbi:hypothetical protein PWT90_03695 [Aphanocladium album]|nr:hypothetical protein PWT90_03695 [Aphanocladium album]